MRTLTTEGATIEVPDCCTECGSIPKDAEAIAYVPRWNELANTCSFCGGRILLISGPYEHVHPKKEKSFWAIQRPEWEPSFECYRTGPFGAVDVHAHQPCARNGMPYCDWDGPVERKGIPEDVELPALTLLSPCGDCGAEITKQDIEKVVAHQYSFSNGSLCAYCGKTIRLLTLTIRHRSLDNRHISRWHFYDWKWEPFFDWTVYRPGNILGVRGHIACGRRAMPFARWEPPRVPAR